MGEATLEKLDPVGFQLYNILEKIKLKLKDKRLSGVRGWGRREHF